MSDTLPQKLFSTSIPANETERLGALYRYRILDTPPEAAFDRITRLAAQMFNMPTVLISLVDETRAWFKSCIGFDACEVPRDATLYNFATLTNDLLIVPDTRLDDRFACNPLVQSEPGVRFYAGAPLLSHDGFNLGTLCLLDSQPRNPLSMEQQSALVDLAAMVVHELELRLAAHQTAQSEDKYRTVLTSMDEGFLIAEVLFDEAGEAVDYRCLEVNPAFYAQTGLPTNIVGLTMREIAPDTPIPWLPIYGQVVKSQSAVRFEYDIEVEELRGYYDVHILPLGEPTEHRVAVLFQNITDRKRREAHLAFLADVANDFSRLSTADEIMQTVGEKIGAYLNITTCNFTDVDEAHDEVTVHHGWSSPTVPSTVGTFRTSQYLSREFERTSRAGETVVICNTQTDPRTDAPGYAALNMHSFVTVPFHHNGRWTHYMAICDSRPRNWREDEIELIEEISNRIFPRLERARAEAALRQSEERYRTLLESIDEGFCVLELLFDQNEVAINYRYIEINPAFEQQTGLIEAVGKTVLEIVPTHESYWFEIYGNVAKTGEAIRFENYANVFNRWFDVYAFRIGNAESRRVAVLFTDITRRKQVEAVLQASHQTFRYLVENSPFGVYVVDADFRLAQVSAGAQKVFENVRPLIGRNFAEVLRMLWQEPFASEAIARFQQTLNTGEPYHSPSTVECRSDVDEIESYDWKIERIPLPDGRFGVVCHFYDLSERQRYEAALRESEERFRNLADNAPVMVWVTDPTGFCTYLSQGWYNFTGQTESTGLGFGWLDGTHPEDREMAQRVFLDANQRQEAFQLEYRLQNKNGEYIWAIDAASPWLGVDGQFKGYIGSVIDINDRKQAEDEREQLLQREQAARETAEQANRIKDEFLAVLSHELRSPLNPILGWTRLLQNGKLDQTRQREALATIERNAKLQTQLIEDLLDISRIMQGKLSLTKASVSLTFVITAAVETVRLAAEAKQIQILLDLTTETALVSGDAARLQQVVWNLLTNAVKFTANGGRVTIELRQIDQLAQIRVIDTGKGIDPQFLPYVFEYFRQADSSTTRKFGGLGLGLVIVRQIVEMHGGTITAESLGENQGATFTVQLPVIGQVIPSISESVQVPVENAVDPLNNLQILVVDDEADTREFQAFVLEQSGARVIAVASGLEALQMLDQTIPDVLVSDVGMALMDGYMLMRQIRSRPPQQGGTIPAIALTAYARDFDRQKAFEAGFQAHITKPVEPEVLVKTITKLLDRS
ncbi:MAG: PAS domain S-box protein [Nostoc sp.]|uniref:PAS domain S-box protein n=1 Tax=Nostoc sp. TaxID=1180 RepID=UPI002FFB8CCE